MNNADVVQSVIDFTRADHDYVILLAQTFTRNGKFTPPTDFAAALTRLKAAKARRDSLETEMYALIEAVDRRGD